MATKRVRKQTGSSPAAPMSAEETVKRERMLRNRLAYCMTFSGRMMELAGAMRAVRWALREGLSDDAIAWMDKIADEVVGRAVAAETDGAIVKHEIEELAAAALSPKEPARLRRGTR